MTPESPATHRSRSRWLLLLIAFLFLAPFVAALLLRFGGWQPGETRNYGELLQPPVDFREQTLQHQDGSAYQWQPQLRHWRMLVVPPRDCGSVCAELADQLRRVWLSEGRHADKLDLLWMGAWPAGAEAFDNRVLVSDAPWLRDALDLRANAEGQLPLYLIDPSGFLVMRYPPGFDPSGLRRDISRLVK